MRWYVASLVGLSVVTACDDADPKKSDTNVADTTASTDTTVAETSVEETSPSDTVDPIDVEVIEGHGSVAGTHLEGIAVQYPEDGLELCAQWREGAPLAEEMGRKVRVVLGKKVTSTLDEDALRTPFDHVLVETSPMRADRHASTSEATSSVSWTLTTGGGGLGTTLFASIEHYLASGGTLIETYTVSRTAELRSPVVIGSGDYEVSFYYRAPSMAEATPLEPCGVGRAGTEDAVTLIVARDEGGKKWAALLRYSKSVEADAGSSPMTLLGNQLIHSDEPWRSHDAWGFWSATYAAMHHNHDETIDVDYTRDLAKWHTVFRHPDPEATPVTHVRAEHLRSGNDGTLTIERVGSDPEVLGVAAGFNQTRVDAAALKATMTCVGAEVLAAGASDHLFQMLLCPDGEDLSLAAVVPVVWSRDITKSGTRIEGEAIKTIENGWSVTIGDDVMEIHREAEGRYYVEVKNAGEVVMSSSEIGYELGKPPVVMTSLVHAAGAGVDFQIYRLWGGPGIGKSQLWAPVYVTLTLDGTTHHVEAWDAMDYTNTHHNWQDELTATTDDGVVIKWRVNFMEGLHNEVSVTGPDGEPLLAPVDLQDVD